MSKLTRFYRKPDLAKNPYKRNLLETLILDDVIRHFLTARKAEGRSASTIESYTYNLSRFSRFAGDGTRLVDVDGNMIREFLGSLKDLDLSEFTIHQHFRSLRVFFYWLVAEGLVEQSPLANVKPPRLPKKRTPTFSPEHIQALLDCCEGKTFLATRNRAMVLFLLDSGVRLSELVNVTVDDINYDSGAVWVKQGKGKRDRVTRIGGTTRRELWRYIILRNARAKPGVEILFLSEEGRPLTPDGVKITLWKLGRQAGIKDVRCSAHTFRHSFAINMLRAGADVQYVKELMGHTSMAPLQTYLSTLNADDAVKAHQMYPTVDIMGLKVKG